MEALFLKIFNMSITASWLACIGIPNDQLSDTDSVEASVVLRVNV